MGELELAAGRVVGTQIKGVSRFAGVPYGAAPIGDRRWRPAAPAGPWPGVRDATSFGPSAWQGDLTGNPALKVLDLVDTNPPSEDCLSVNVWTPEISRSVRLPVLVWIHGGASVVGSPAMPLYDGSVLARDQQLVVVTVGFRLGVFGFFAHDLVDSLGNQALTDISLALDWVQQNISAFGGDSSNVTVAGESSGSAAIVALLTGEIRPPVRRAILCSGFHNLITTAETARNLGVELSHEVGEPADLRAVAAPDLIAAQNALDSPSWGPAAECDGVPKTPLAAAEAGSAAGIDVLVLTNRDETGLFMGLNPEFDDPDDLATIDAAADYAGSPQRAKQLLAAYRDARQARGEATANRWLLIAVSTDAVFRNPANALADALAAHGNVHVGVFEHPSPALDGRLGACHAMMLPFAFGTYDHSSCATLAGTTVNRQLTERVAITAQSVWARFAATGDPGWTAYTTGSRTTGRIADAITSQSDPFVAERYAWNE